MNKVRLNKAIVIVAILLIRLPFLNQAISGDDVYYLASAEHAQIDPLHPNHTHYVFQGRDVDFQGYPHPPLNAWMLAGLLAAFGDVRQIPFHTVYILFSLLAGLAMLSLAQRFSPYPLLATLLFLAVPAFVVNGNSFESDIPLLAFWMAGIAAFIGGRLLAAAVLLSLASLVATQAVLAIPILWVYLWLYDRPNKAAWVVALAPAFATGTWQLFEFLSSGRFPAQVTAGYLSSYGLERLSLKLMNAAGLSVHSCFMICPLLLPAAVLLAWKRRGDQDTKFLAAWIGIFFLGALALFYSGSARYLLPMAAPFALLASRLPSVWLWAGFAAQMALSLSLATVNYQHWDGYRQFAHSLSSQTQTRRTWVNGEWGLRYYLDADGARPILENQRIPAGDLIVSSELAYPVPYNRGGTALVPIASREIYTAIPLRLIGLDSHSGYSTVGKGLLPFGISRGPIDRVHADLLKTVEPTLEYLPMDAPEADQQIISGIYSLEGNTWRWTAGTAVIMLKSPKEPERIHVGLAIADVSPVRTVKVFLDQKEIASHTFPKPGNYAIDTEPQSPRGATALVTITVDKPFTVPTDHREFGLILTGVGFRK